MKPFSELSAEELAMENLFIRWVRFPDDPPIRSFWESWILKYPSQKDTVAKARELVLIASDWRPDNLSSQDVNSIWGRIMSSLDIMGDRDSKSNLGIEDGGLSAGNIILILMSVTFLIFVFYFILGNS